MTTVDLPPCDTDDWQDRHNDAVLDPTFTERPIVWLQMVAGQLVNQHAHDKTLREAPVKVLEAMRVLLDSGIGRLDGGTVSAWIEEQMERCNYDPATGRFTDST